MNRLKASYELIPDQNLEEILNSTDTKELVDWILQELRRELWPESTYLTN